MTVPAAQPLEPPWMANLDPTVKGGIVAATANFISAGSRALDLAKSTEMLLVLDADSPVRSAHSIAVELRAAAGAYEGWASTAEVLAALMAEHIDPRDDHL